MDMVDLSAAAGAKLEAARVAQAEVERLEDSYRGALARRAELIRELAKTMTVRDIAEHLGISFQRVGAITAKHAKK